MVAAGSWGHRGFAGRGELTLQIGFLVINWGFDLASHCNVLRGWKSVAVEGEEFRHDQQEIGDLGKKQ